MSGLPNTLIFPLMEQLAEHGGPAVDGMYQVAPQGPPTAVRFGQP